MQSNSGASATEINDWLSQQIDQTYFGGTGEFQSLAEQYGIGEESGDGEPVAPVGAVAFAAPPAHGGLLNPPVVPQADPDAFPENAPAALKIAPLTRLKGTPQKFVNYEVWNKYVWDGNDTTILRQTDFGVEGLFDYDHRVMSHKTGHTEQKFEYIDASEHAQAQADLAAKQAELPGLQSTADELSEEVIQLAAAAAAMTATGIKWGGLSYYFGPTTLGAVTFSIGAVYAIAAGVVGYKATVKSAEASGAQQQVHNCELEIQSLKDKVETGQGLVWWDATVTYDEVDEIRPWQSIRVVKIWQPAEIPYGLPISAGSVFGASNDGPSVIGPNLVGGTTYEKHSDIPEFFRQYVPQ